MWTALAVLVVFEALAITGSILYARSVNHDARRAAADVARAAARSIETVLDHLIAPVMSLANLVHLVGKRPLEGRGGVGQRVACCLYMSCEAFERGLDGSGAGAQFE